MLSKSPFITVTFLALSLTACQDYQFSVNEKELYRPPAAITELEATDTALMACLDQHIKDANITDSKALKRLNCSSAGITDVNGLNQFLELTQINLADNQLSQLEGLLGMTQLKDLDLSNNRVADIQPLFSMNRLRWVDLQGNEAVACADIKQLERVTGAQVISPNHCLAK